MKEDDFSEDEERRICEHAMQTGQYEQVIKLCIKNQSKGSMDGFWIINLAEAYLASNRQTYAEELTEACCKGNILLEGEDFDRILEVKARLLFQKGQAADAYEIADELCSKYPDKMRYRLTYAAMCMMSGKTADAVRIYSSLQSDMPDNPFFAYELGRCMMKQKKYEQAHVYFSIALKNNPDFSRALYEMALASIGEGNLKNAEKETDLLYGKIDESNRNYLKGRICEKKEKFHEAKEIYRKLIEAEHMKKNNKDPELLYSAYERYFLMRKAAGASVVSQIRNLESVLKELPDCAQLWMMLGEIRENCEADCSQAAACYRKAYQTDPYYEKSLKKIIDYEINAENWQNAMVYCERMITNTGNCEYYLIQAKCAAELGLDEAFAGDIAAYIRQGGDERKTYELCSMYAMKKGDYDKAEGIYKKQLADRVDKEIPCYTQLAVCLCKQGKFEEAEAVLKSAANTGENNTDWLYMLYKIKMFAGDFKGASRILKRIRRGSRITASDTEYKESMIRIFMEEGHFAVAGKLAERLNCCAGEQLSAILYVLRGSYRNAIKLFRKLIEIEPDVPEHYGWMVLCQALWGKRSGAADYAKQGLKVFAEKHVSAEKLGRPDYLCQYGLLLYFAGLPKQAYDVFEKAVCAVTCCDEICQYCYEAYFGIGICKAFDCDWRAADAAFARALTIKPHNIVCRKLSENLKNSFR